LLTGKISKKKVGERRVRRGKVSCLVHSLSRWRRIVLRPFQTRHLSLVSNEEEAKVSVRTESKTRGAAATQTHKLLRNQLVGSASHPLLSFSLRPLLGFQVLLLLWRAEVPCLTSGRSRKQLVCTAPSNFYPANSCNLRERKVATRQTRHNLKFFSCRANKAQCGSR